MSGGSAVCEKRYIFRDPLVVRHYLRIHTGRRVYRGDDALSNKAATLSTWPVVLNGTASGSGDKQQCRSAASRLPGIRLFDTRLSTDLNKGWTMVSELRKVLAILLNFFQS